MPSSTDRSHVIRTSQQWESAIDKYSVIPWGVLCIELTPDGKTKAKVGEGNKFYSQLPYISNEIDLSKYYTKDEVDLIIENLEFMSIKETVPYDSRNSLPRTGNKLGDVRFVKNLANPGDDPLMYIWNGTKWAFSGGSIIDIDLSEYAKKSEVYPRLQQLEALSHAHRNKNILDATSAVYTVEKDEKLASLKNYDVFVPATATTDGEEGLVPAPLAGEQSYYLRGDGTWAKVKSGDKYKAGDGIYILAGDASSTTLPVEIYAKANKLKQYVLYGGENPVGDWDSTLSKYAVVIKVSAEGMSDISTSLFLDDPIGNGDYIDYENQRFVHTRTNIRFDVRLGEWGRWIHADGTTTGEYTYQDRMAPSDYIAVSSEYVYLYYPGDMHGCDQFGIHCYAALYDENKVFTRSILLRSFTEVTIEPQPGEAYMRVSYGYYQGATYRLTKIGEVVTPIVLPPVLIYTNKVNTIDVMTTNKPTEVYFETAVVEDTSEDPMSEYTGIIYNEGVLDITQENPNALNELTVHFRESDKVITIDAGVNECVVNITQEDPDNLNELTISYADGTSTVINIPGGSGDKYVAGAGISITDGGPINTDYYFDTQVSCNLSGNRLTMTYTKYNTEPAFGAIVSVYTNESFTGPVFVGRTPDSVKYTSNTGNPQGTVVYRDETWYYSTFNGWVDGERVDTLNNMQKIEGLFNVPAQTEDIVFAILDAGHGSPSVAEKEISVIPATTETIGGVIVGGGLEIDEDGVLSAPGGRTYVAGDGVVISDNTSFELSEDTVTNTEYFFDTRVTSNVLGRTFTKYNAEPALGAVVYASSYTQPFFVGLTADSVKYGTDYNSQIWPNPDHPSFEYKGVTWYYSGFEYAMSGDGTDTSGHMQKLSGTYSVSTEADLQNIARAIIDAADIITDSTKRISVKLGSGLSVDNNNALQVNAGDCLEIDTNNNIKVDISRTTIFFNNNPNS